MISPVDAFAKSEKNQKAKSGEDFHASGKNRRNVGFCGWQGDWKFTLHPRDDKRSRR